MQQISQTQQRLEHRLDSQRIKNKFKTPSLFTPQRLKTNPQSDQRNIMTPGRLYLRSVDTHKHKNYYTIDTDFERVDSPDRQDFTGLKGFQRLPQIKHNKYRIGQSELHRKKKYLSYKNPTINSLLNSQGKQKNLRNYDYKRICSVNCITRQQKMKKKKAERQQNHTDSNVRQNALKRYLANEYKARYPSTQVKNYLAQMKLQQIQGKQRDMEQDRNYYETFFGLQPEFYKLLTEYAIQASAPNQFECSRFTSYRNTSFPAIPKSEDIAEFIENYVSFSKEINVQKLMKEPNFLVEYTPTDMYFGQMLSSEDTQQNIRQGIGVLITKNICFEGIFQNNQKLKGCEINYSGIYKGQFRNNKKQGTGQFQWNNREYYIGDWKDGQRHGNGVWTNKSGDSYNGEWVKGRSEGNGIYITQGRQYRGDFVDFKKDGWGKQKLANQDLYEGGFKDGLPHGKGIYIWANGTRYQGQFTSGFRNGKGLLSTIDGFVYNGQFFDEKPQGLCQIFMPNGDIYQGYLRNGKKNGRGILMLKQSHHNLDGFWQNDMFISKIK